MKPHRIIKRMEFTEDEWLRVYKTAKALGVTPMELAKQATLKIAENTLVGFVR